MHIIIVYYQKIIGSKTETRPHACDITMCEYEQAVQWRVTQLIKMNAIQHDTDTDGLAWARCLTLSDATSTLVSRILSRGLEYLLVNYSSNIFLFEYSTLSVSGYYFHFRLQ